MTIPTLEQVDQLSRADLLSLVKHLLLVVKQQQKQIAELEAEIAKLGSLPELR
jgi:cell division protein FtsB